VPRSVNVVIAFSGFDCNGYVRVANTHVSVCSVNGSLSKPQIRRYPRGQTDSTSQLSRIIINRISNYLPKYSCRCIALAIAEVCYVLFFYGRPYVVMDRPLCFTPVIYYCYFFALLSSRPKNAAPLDLCQDVETWCNFITQVRKGPICIPYILRGKNLPILPPQLGYGATAI